MRITQIRDDGRVNTLRTLKIEQLVEQMKVETKTQPVSKMREVLPFMLPGDKNDYVQKVVTDHKMKDADLEPDVDRLRENERFKKELIKMLGKLDNSRPNSAKNQKIMRILERAGKEVYNELK